MHLYLYWKHLEAFDRNYRYVRSKTPHLIDSLFICRFSSSFFQEHTYPSCHPYRYSYHKDDDQGRYDDRGTWFIIKGRGLLYRNKTEKHE